MKSGDGIMRAWMLRGGVILLGVMLLVGTLLWALSGIGHNPNHDISMEQAKAASRRVHTPPEPGVKMMPGHGG